MRSKFFIFCLMLMISIRVSAAQEQHECKVTVHNCLLNTVIIAEEGWELAAGCLHASYDSRAVFKSGEKKEALSLNGVVYYGKVENEEVSASYKMIGSWQQVPVSEDEKELVIGGSLGEFIKGESLEEINT